MDYSKAIETVFEHLNAGHADKAVMACLRISRNLKDFLNAAIFLRELYVGKEELQRVLLDDMSHLKEDAMKFIWDKSLDRWIVRRTLEFSFGSSEDGEKKNVLAIGIGEVNPEISQWKRTIQDLAVPPGMTPYDTAFFLDQMNNQRAEIGLKIKALEMIKQRVMSFCLNYAIGVELQLQAQAQSQGFLDKIQNVVNNYFKAQSEDVYTKLIKAAQLIDSNDHEDYSLLLTQVRRAIKAVADFLYPPRTTPVTCSDGKIRPLGDDQYLNRLNEFLATSFRKSTANELLSAEFEHLAVFARRLNEVASKGVHADVSAAEAKQGLLGLYMFLFNVISRLQEKSGTS